MMRKIRIGYIGRNNSWEQLLEQIGVHWNRVTPKQSIPTNEYSCLIVDRDLNQSGQAIVDRFLKNKGAVIDATGQCVSESLHARTFSSVYPEDEVHLFGHIEQIPVYGSCQSVSDSGSLNGLVWFDPSPDRNLAYVGLPVHRLWNEIKPLHRQFGSVDNAVTAERTSALQSHPYLEVILTLLRKLHDDIELPLVHTWWHPDSDKQAATFRIDSDYGSRNSIKEVSGLAVRSDIPLTWFLHAAFQEGWMKTLINSISVKNEISLHCYRHFEYKTIEQIRSDVIQGKEILKRNGIDPPGYAAPYGYWSNELADALKRFPFSYTSEFGYDYDSLPSVAAGSGILQLPIHPVSIGSFSRFGVTSSQVTSYFEDLVRYKRLQHLPLHLYHHPNDGSPSQLKELFETVSSGNYQWMTYSDWGQWWKQRSAQTSHPAFDTETGKLHLTSSDRSRYPVAIHHRNRFHISISNESVLYLEELPLRPYITANLLTLVKERRDASRLSWFRLKKDQWLTHLWRNRA